MAGDRKKEGQGFLIQGPWELLKLAPISALQAYNSYATSSSLSHNAVF